MHKYAICGSLIGVMEIVDAVILYMNGGICGSISMALSTLEFIWAIVSIVMLIRTKHRPTRMLALVFVVYNGLGWLSSIFIVSPSIPVIIPMWAVIFGGVFGLCYAIGAIYVAKQPSLSVTP